MEIVSKNYNCRNNFVAGFLPVLLEANREGHDEPDFKSISRSHSTSSLSTESRRFVITSYGKSFQNLNVCSYQPFSRENEIPIPIYRIDTSKGCTATTPRSNECKPCTDASSSHQQSSQKTKSKKTLRNKRQKEARRKRRNQRHVHFPEQEDLIAIVIIIEDDECIRESRNKYWEFFAIDRDRFKHRIQNIADTLNRILAPSHRDQIYKERFSSDNGTVEENKSDSVCDSLENIEQLDQSSFTKENIHKLNYKIRNDINRLSSTNEINQLSSKNDINQLSSKNDVNNLEDSSDHNTDDESNEIRIPIENNNLKHDLRLSISLLNDCTTLVFHSPE